MLVGGLAMKGAQFTAAKHADRHSRMAHLLRITCPYCRAPAGEPCRSKSGTPPLGYSPNTRRPPHGPAAQPDVKHWG